MKIINLKGINIALLVLLMLAIGYIIGTKNSYILGTTTSLSPTVATIPTPIISKTVNPTTDPDPFVICNIDQRCGGEKKIRKSECDNSVCCELSESRYMYYKNKTQCSKDQAEITSNRNLTSPTEASKVAVYLTYSGQTFYCKSEGVDAIKSADTNNTKLLNEYKTCVSQASVIYASCTNNCAINDPSDACRNSCKERYSYESCTKPDEDGLNKLLNQYCK